MKCQKSLQQALNRKLYTVLNDRVLFFDGDSVIDANDISSFISNTRSVYVNEITDEIREFNKNRLMAKRIKEKTEFKGLDTSWNIPGDYQTLDLSSYIFDRLYQVSIEENLTEEQVKTRAVRVKQELERFDQLNLNPVLRTIIFIINTLTKQNIVWGVGRGSSVSSYVLYLIGVHDVDSVEYELDYMDFLRTSE